MTHENISPIEYDLELFNSHVDQGIKKAFEMVRDRFENAPRAYDNLPFHNMQHTRGVTERMAQVLEAVQKVDPSAVDGRTLSLGRLIAAYHDVVQKYETVEHDDGRKTRRRFAGDNERVSAEELVVYMENTNRNFGEEIFSQDDMNLAREAIAGTVPGFDPDVGTVIQPNINRESSLTAQALALADLGAAGMGNPEFFSLEGDALFREENLDILDAVNGEGISDDKKKEYRQRMLGWTKSQVPFIEGRRALLLKEVDKLPDLVREAVSDLFSSFDETLKRQREVIERREHMSFEDLVQDMGYSLK